MVRRGPESHVLPGTDIRELTPGTLGTGLRVTRENASSSSTTSGESAVLSSAFCEYAIAIPSGLSVRVHQPNSLPRSSSLQRPSRQVPCSVVSQRVMVPSHSFGDGPSLSANTAAPMLTETSTSDGGSIDEESGRAAFEEWTRDGNPSCLATTSNPLILSEDILSPSLPSLSWEEGSYRPPTPPWDWDEEDDVVQSAACRARNNPTNNVLVMVLRLWVTQYRSTDDHFYAMARSRGFARRSRRTTRRQSRRPRRSMRFSRKSAVGRIRRRMARRIRARRGASLSKRLEYGPDFKQRVRAHVSHQRFDSITDGIKRDPANPGQLQVHNDYSVYRCAFVGEAAPSANNIRSFGIVDILVRDRWMQRYRYARLQKVVFSLKWHTPNPPRSVDIGGRVTTYNLTTTTGPAPAGLPPATVGFTTGQTSEWTGSYPVQGYPYWQAYMFWDPEHRYDDVDPIELRRQGIPVKCITLRPGKIIRWTNYPVRKTIGFTASGVGLVNSAEEMEDEYAGVQPIASLVSGSGAAPAIWGPLRYDKRFYPTEIHLNKPILGSTTAIQAIGWRLTIVPPFWDGSSIFPTMYTRSDGNAWPYQYDLSTAGYWLFRGDKWSSSFLAPAGSDPMDDDEFNDIEHAPEVSEFEPPEEPEVVPE